ncbi:ester cyclase [Sagittula sp. SSi028]|uniref:nuclear transport factor 2 family protein n=1 Tax=Sagittula sp. SSi028 TaxID=3400636 RepID=UPI003AF7A7D5
MQAEDAGYKDFPDYMRKGVASVWALHAPPAVRDRFFHPAVIYRDARGIAQGPQDVWQMGQGDLSALPDRRVMVEDVIATGSERRGFAASCRVVVAGRHLRDGPLGPATGRMLRYRSMVDQFAKAQRVSDAWQVVDTADIARQAGLDVQRLAQARLEDAAQDDPAYCPETDVPGPYTGRGNDISWGGAYGDLLGRVMSGDNSRAEQHYAAGVLQVSPGGAEAHGVRAAIGFWQSVRQAFPDADFRIHHQMGQETPAMPPRAALRWSLTGQHAGWGWFGAPTQARVHVAGIAQAEFGPDGLRREWVLFDAVAVWMQILAETG